MKKNKNVFSDAGPGKVKSKKIKISHGESLSGHVLKEPLSKTLNSKHENVLQDILSSEYTTDLFKTKMLNCFEGNNFCNSDSKLSISNDPFKYAFLPNFMKNEQLVSRVKEDLEGLPLLKKNNDLYQFKGTEDLQCIPSDNIEQICKYLKGPIRLWLKQVTGINLNKKVSISSSRYDYTDVLLCHDDELQGRRIAFVLYFVPSPWKKDYGGSLDLFSMDKLGRPHVIKKRLYPEFNSFVFFEVSETSYHQVSEILVEDKSRISINGWFYGEPLDYPDRHRLVAPIFVNPCSVEEHLVYSWINPLFIEPNTQQEIRQEFQDKSEIQLDEFIKNKKYKLLLEALGDDDMWTFVGPPYKRNYEVCQMKKYPPILNEFTKLMSSDAMVLILSQLTGLQLHRLAPEDSDSDESSHSENEAHPNKEESDSSCDVKSPKSKNEIPRVTKKKKKNGRASGVKALKSTEEVEDLRNNILGEESRYDGSGGLGSGWSSHVNKKELKAIKEDRKNDGENHKAEINCEVRRWDWGSYSLMRDDDLLNNNGSFILDTMLFCNVNKEWKDEYGGGVVYVAKGEEEELLTIVPSSNSLALVYRDEKTFQFTKFINAKARKAFKEKSRYHEIYCGYRENKS